MYGHLFWTNLTSWLFYFSSLLKFRLSENSPLQIKRKNYIFRREYLSYDSQFIRKKSASSGARCIWKVLKTHGGKHGVSVSAQLVGTLPAVLLGSPHGEWARPRGGQDEAGLRADVTSVQAESSLGLFLHKALPPSWNHTERTFGATRKLPGDPRWLSSFTVRFPSPVSH